jgi:hypothetical protein
MPCGADSIREIEPIWRASAQASMMDPAPVSAQVEAGIAATDDPPTSATEGDPHDDAP